MYTVKSRGREGNLPLKPKNKTKKTIVIICFFLWTDLLLSSSNCFWGRICHCHLVTPGIASGATSGAVSGIASGATSGAVSGKASGAASGTATGIASVTAPCSLSG